MVQRRRPRGRGRQRLVVFADVSGRRPERYRRVQHDASDALAASSNWGQDVFLAAPGRGISATEPGGSYGSISGTSASAAEVAAAAALLRAVDPAASNGVIVGRLARNADAAGTVDQTGNGRLNLFRSLGDTSTVSVQPVGAAPTGSGGPFVGPYVVAAVGLSTQQCQPGNPPLPNGPSTNCKDGTNPSGWKSGLNSGPFLQGDSVPYRALFNSTVVGQSYTVTIKYDITKAGEHAIDYLTTFNRTLTNADACTAPPGPNGPGGTAAICADVHTFAIPIDPQVTAGLDGMIGTADDITQVAGNFTLYGGTITSVAYAAGAGTVTGNGTVGSPYDYSGDHTRYITVVFTADQASTNGLGPCLAWGGHIAKGGDWSGRANPQGSPYHMSLSSFTCGPSGGGCGTGASDLALNSGAVVATNPGSPRPMV